MNTATHSSRRPFQRVRPSLKSPRVTTHLVAEAKCGDKQVVGWLLDVSLEGIFLRHSDPFELGERVSMEFYLPGPGSLPGAVIRCIGVVTSKVEAGKLWPSGNRLAFWVMRPAHRNAVGMFIASRVRPRLAGATVSTVEESLLFSTVPISFLADLTPAGIQCLSIDTLPDVGAFLEELTDEERFEGLNDVGSIEPDDFVLLH